MTETPDQNAGLVGTPLPMDPDQIMAQTAFGPTFVRQDVPQGEQQEELSDEERQIRSDLDDDAQLDFTGLMRLGYLEDTCTIAGHRFLLRTPSHDARIERGMLHREYLNSMNTEPLWRLLTVAAYCVEIDDRPAPTPLNTRSAGVTDRLRWVKETIFSTVMIEKLYLETLRLDARERDVVEYLDGQTKS